MRRFSAILMSIMTMFICACSTTVNEDGRTPPPTPAKEVNNSPHISDAETTEPYDGENFSVMGIEYPATCVGFKFTQPINSIDELAELKQFNAVRELDIMLGDEFEGLEKLAEYSGLTTLKLCNYRGTLAPLCELKELKSLVLSYCGGVDLSELAGSSVETLVIWKDAAPDLSGLKKLKSLKKLVIQHCHGKSSDREMMPASLHFYRLDPVEISVEDILACESLEELMIVCDNMIVGNMEIEKIFVRSAEDKMPEWAALTAEQAEMLLERGITICYSTVTEEMALS